MIDAGPLHAPFSLEESMHSQLASLPITTTCLVPMPTTVIIDDHHRRRMLLLCPTA